MNPIPAEFWIVVTELDMDRGFCHIPPMGPLVHEGYCLTEEQAVERAKRLAGRYGWSTVVKVTPDYKRSI